MQPHPVDVRAASPATLLAIVEELEPSWEAQEAYIAEHGGDALVEWLNAFHERRQAATAELERRAATALNQRAVARGYPPIFTAGREAPPVRFAPQPRLVSCNAPVAQRGRRASRSRRAVRAGRRRACRDPDGEPPPPLRRLLHAIARAFGRWSR